MVSVFEFLIQKVNFPKHNQLNISVGIKMGKKMKNIWVKTNTLTPSTTIITIIDRWIIIDEIKINLLNLNKKFFIYKS